MLARKIGRIDISDLTTPPNKDELRTAGFFAKRGKDIKFIRPSNKKGDHKADFIMDGKRWEVKHPRSNSSRTIEDRFRKAKSQSHCIIFDLCNSKMSNQEAIRKIKKEFNSHPEVKEVIVLDKTRNIIELIRKA